MDISEEAMKLGEAIRLATLAHEGQTRRDSETAYIVHPLRVMVAVGHALADDDRRVSAMIAAVLHDTVEDTPVTLKAIETQFGAEIASWVDAMTRRESETHFESIIRVQEAGMVPTEIKIQDIRDNRRRPFPFGWSMWQRYTRALSFLLGEGTERYVETEAALFADAAELGRMRR